MNFLFHTTLLVMLFHTHCDVECHRGLSSVPSL